MRTLAKAVLGALLSWLARFSPRKVGVALLYHGVADDPRARRDVLVPSMPPALFASQLALLTHHYKLVPASALLAAIAARRIGGRIPLAITFDDDDHTHPTTAARLLRDADAPATFFVNAESPDEPRPLWWQQLQRAWDEHKIDTELLAMLGLPPGPERHRLGLIGSAITAAAARSARARSRRPTQADRRRPGARRPLTRGAGEARRGRVRARLPHDPA